MTMYRELNDYLVNNENPDSVHTISEMKDIFKQVNIDNFKNSLSNL